MNRNEKYELKCNEMIEIAEQFLPLNSWDFRQSDRLVAPHPIVIYDSEWCRLKLLWEGWDMYAGDTVMVYYGRLHAVSDKFTMKWKGEECYCWHDIKMVINVLDGLSPKEAFEQLYVHGQWPRVMEEFKESEVGKSLVDKQPEWLIRMHAVAWEHYGQRFLEMFDLRRPDLWEKYVDFLKKYHRLVNKGPIPIDPPLYKAC